MTEAMRMTIDEVLNESIMSSTPAIIVEGINDLKAYISIAKSARDNYEVYAVETISGYSAGCEQVRQAICALYELQDTTHPIENFVLGIIDRDVREFRNEIPLETAILILKHYSIESHFVCKEVLEKILQLFAIVHADKLGLDFSRELFAEIEAELLELYYFSLEALRCSLDPQYVAEFKYSYSPNRRKTEPAKSSVIAKKEELDNFANSLGLAKDLTTLNKIASGKWLLTTFCESLEAKLSGFTNYCGKFGAEQCEFCRIQVVNKCTYRVKPGVNHKTFYAAAFETTDLAPFDYIRQRISQISLQSVPAFGQV